MFFILSKILVFLLSPILWIGLFLLLGILIKNRVWKKRSLYLAGFLFFFFTNPFIINQTLLIWEVNSSSATDITSSYDVGILLGGYAGVKRRPTYNRFVFNKSVNRLTQTLKLYQEGKIKKILLTGGSGNLMQPKTKESEVVKQYLIQMGFPEADLFIEPASRNTRENAIFSKDLLQKSQAQGQFLLITSAWHMPRAMACFKKAGLKVKPYSTDFLGEKQRYWPEHILIPSAQALISWEVLLKEWTGYFMYKLKGYI